MEFNTSPRHPLPERAPVHKPRCNPLAKRPNRITVINGDDVLNLRIALETMTWDEFECRMFLADRKES